MNIEKRIYGKGYVGRFRLNPFYDLYNVNDKDRKDLNLWIECYYWENVDIKMMGSAEWAFLWSGIIGF